MKRKALELLEQGVATLLESNAWRRSLEIRARLHSYSFRNCLLILLQRPDASMVAGYNRWLELGRQVRKGEKGIAILAPLVRRDKESGEVEMFGVKTTHVFDISQTDGEPLPDVAPRLLTEDSATIRAATARLEAFARARGLRLERAELGHARGSFDRRANTITLAPDLPPLQTLKTLIHELAHAILHAAPRDTPRRVMELEAESCAFVTCHALGLDTSRYSFAYLAHWLDEPAELLGAGERAVKASAELLAALEADEAMAA